MIWDFLTEESLMSAGFSSSDRRSSLTREMIQMKAMTLKKYVDPTDDPLSVALTFVKSFPTWLPEDARNEAALCVAAKPRAGGGRCNPGDGLGC